MNQARRFVNFAAALGTGKPHLLALELTPK